MKFIHLSIPQTVLTMCRAVFWKQIQLKITALLAKAHTLVRDTAHEQRFRKTVLQLAHGKEVYRVVERETQSKMHRR